jgi:hypothetical protein
MSDFLSRLAGRALRQTPVLEPLVASWQAPLEAGEMLAPDFEVADESERRAPGQRALDRRSPMGVGRRAEARDVGVVAAAALPGDPVLRSRATARTPTERGVDTVVEVEPAAAQLVVDAKEPMVAAPEAVVVNRASARSAEDYTRTEDYQGEAHVQRPEGTPAPAVGALEEFGPPRERVVEHETTVREEPGVVVERTPAVDRPRQSSPSVSQARREEPAAPGRTTVEHAREEIEPGGVARPRHELHVPAAEAPTITVSIGRIEVRAAPAAPAVPARAAEPRKGPRLSLDEYLAQRNGSQR